MCSSDLGAFVWRLLRRLGVPYADLDDLTQEVFLSVHRALASYEERNQLKAWLYRIAVREAVRHRRTRPPPSSMDIEDLDEASPDCPEATAQANEARERFNRLLETLDEPRRTVFVLYEIEEMTMSEIAQLLEIPIGTVASRLRRARTSFMSHARSDEEAND